MKPNIALVLFYLYHGYTYEIEMTVPCKSATYARLHKCIQPFVRSANFKYELVINSATESLNMVADIADDISESIITKYCEQYATINRKTNVQDTYEQSKEFVGEKSSMGDGHNPASDEISVYSYKGESSNPQGVTTRSCLILQPNLPELWIQDCTRCLAFEKQYERFFVTRKDLGSYQWAFLYTFAEKKILHCQSTCGTVTLVSETDCYAARLYQTLPLAFPSRPKDLTDFSYEQHLVPYTKETMEKCISCAQNNILPFIMNNNEGEMNFVAYTDPGFELRLFKLNCVTTSMCKAPKTLLSKKVDDLLANFKALGSSKDEPRNPDKEDTTSSSTCMHFSTSVYAAGNAYMYPIMMNYPASKPHTQFPSCYSCMLKELGRVDHVPSLEDLVESIQPTSSRSSLVFFKQELHVQEAAIRCTEKCKWVTGLSKKVCAFLGDMAIIEKKRSQIDSVGTHSTAARPPKRKANEVTIGENDPMVTYALMSASTHSFIPSNEKAGIKTKLHNAIKTLSLEASNDAVWFLQFDQREKFQSVAFCIASMSNSYVVSSASLYILTSPFEYMLLDAFCKLPSKIEVKVYKNIQNAMPLQPSDFTSVIISLDFERSSQDKNHQRIDEQSNADIVQQSNADIVQQSPMGIVRGEKSRIHWFSTREAPQGEIQMLSNAQQQPRNRAIR